MRLASDQTPSQSLSWKVAYWTLGSVFLLTAALNLCRIRGGFLTNHTADLTVPALLYIVTRRYPPSSVRAAPMRLRQFFGYSPEVAAFLIFGGSTATELSQRFWPHGIFRGTYDPLDLIAYGVSVAIPYVADRLALRHTDRSRIGASVRDVA